jgi:acetyltransferase-like isoleucine patch superfamily enzyme
MSASDRTPVWRWWSASTVRWILRHRAWSGWYLIRYWRFIRLRITHPDVIVTGPVFLGKRVRFERRKYLGRIILGRWVHLGDGTVLRAHEGTLRVGDKCVFGQNNTVNCHLDVSIGSDCIVADWVYIGDFDHQTELTSVPIRAQGLIKSPVIIDSDVWLGVKSTILRGSHVGRGSVIAANSVVRGEVPEFSIAGGVPAKVLVDRRQRETEREQVRRDVADMARKAREATTQRIAAQRAEG